MTILIIILCTCMVITAHMINTAPIYDEVNDRYIYANDKRIKKMLLNWRISVKFVNNKTLKLKRWLGMMS